MSILQDAYVQDALAYRMLLQCSYKQDALTCRMLLDTGWSYIQDAHASQKGCSESYM